MNLVPMPYRLNMEKRLKMLTYTHTRQTGYRANPWIAIRLHLRFMQSTVK